MNETTPQNEKGYSVQLDISNPRRNEICEFLDAFNDLEKFCEINPSILLKGGWYAMQKENRIKNLDWMAQSAHSFREIHYGLQDAKSIHFILKRFIILNAIKLFKYKAKNIPKNRKDKISDSLKTYIADEVRRQEISTAINKIYIAFTKIAHHFKNKNSLKDTLNILSFLKINQVSISNIEQESYDKLVDSFESFLLNIKPKGLDSHKIINDIIINKNFDEKKIKSICFSSGNSDAKRYFFSKIDETWLDWLYKKSFFEAIKKQAVDTTTFYYQLSELDYLTRMAAVAPSKVTEIILNNDNATKEEKFNPEVIARFLWIISELPSEQIKLVTAKIRDEKWIYLMKNFRKSGYEFKKIVEKLSQSKENNSILELAQAFLIVKSKDEIPQKDSFSDKEIFYATDIDASGIFEALSEIEDPYVEKALKITTSTMNKIIELAEPDETKTFKYEDSYALFDVDFFELEVKDNRSYSSFREDIKNIAAAIKNLIIRSIGNNCSNPQEAKRLFEYIDKLPSCRSMWRLRLFALSQCPEVFKEEIKESLFRLFEVDNYYEIEGGAEYQKTLKIAFPYFSEADQRDYVKKVFKYFSAKMNQYQDQSWHKRTGWEILSCICECLKENEIKECQDIFGNKCDKEYKPKKDVGDIRSGMVHNVSPENLEDYSIEEIIKNLKSEWTPEKLNERFKNDDFLNPRGAEGLGDALKEDVKKRLDDYLKNINLFFDRDNIHSHYLYSLLRGIEEILRNKQSLNLEQIKQIFGLFEIIKNEGEKIPFIRIKDDRFWLVGWVETHTVITDILLHILRDNVVKDEVQKEHRELIKNLISYLFTIKDSPSKENEKPEYGEPYGVAINSVRGRAYEAFVLFSENDGKTLAADVKDIYKKVLEDEVLAIRFVIGRYLAFFYFRDKKFITELLPEIFPRDSLLKKDIYLATWEGYLSNVLYDKSFVALREYYQSAITFDPKEYTERKYSKGLDESLAIHLALAFVHFDMEFDDPLFVEFWKIPNTNRHEEFISFIGRSCISRDQAGDEWLEKNNVSKEKLIKFWDWTLENVTEPKSLAGFGFWINPNKEVLDDKLVIDMMAKTIKKSDGNIDWDYGLLERLPIFAQKDPAKTLEIISNYLLDSENNLNQNRRAPLLYQEEMKKSLSIVYQNGTDELKKKVTDLINILIEKGSSTFWGLEEIVQ